MFYLRPVRPPPDCDHIKPAFSALRPLEMQVSLGDAAELLLLAKPDRKLGAAEVIISSRLYFDEDESLAVHADQIDLAEINAPIAGHRPVSARSQPLLGEIFSRALNQLPSVWFIHDCVEGNLWV
jgi:hypothetical protein